MTWQFTIPQKSRLLKLIGSDHPVDLKKDGIYIFYKEHILLIKRDDYCTLDDFLVTKIRSQN